MDTPDATDTDADTNMTDGVTNAPAIERTSLDAIRQLLNLAAVLKEPNLKARVRQLQRAEARAGAAQERLAAERAAFDKYEQTIRAELEQERAAVTKRRDDAEIAEDRVAQKERHYIELERAWRDIQLPQHVLFGSLTREPAHTALEKAKFATEHGRLPEDDEPVMREDTGNEFERPAHWQNPAGA
jgi:hypothetical protein